MLQNGFYLIIDSLDSQDQGQVNFRLGYITQLACQEFFDIFKTKSPVMAVAKSVGFD